MAEEDDNAEEGEAGGGKKKLIIIIVAVLILLLGGGGAAYYFLFMGDEEVVAEDGEDAEGAEEEGGFFSSGKGKPIYHKLRPKFITTFDANSRQRYVQVEVTLVTRDESVVSQIINHQPLIRNAIVTVLGNQDYLTLQTLDGKNKLRREVVAAVQDILQQEADTKGIESVLFTEFVMQ